MEQPLQEFTLVHFHHATGRPGNDFYLELRELSTDISANLSIVTVVVDDIEGWLDIRKKYDLSWKFVTKDCFWHSNIRYPENLLIDPHGKIVAQNIKLNMLQNVISGRIRLFSLLSR